MKKKLSDLLYVLISGIFLIICPKNIESLAGFLIIEILFYRYGIPNGILPEILSFLLPLRDSKRDMAISEGLIIDISLRSLNPISRRDMISVEFEYEG